MRLCSTSESAERGEISALAIVETIVAMGLTIWLAARYHTVIHVAISGFVAPLLLFRTDASTKLALSWFEEGRIGGRFFFWFNRFGEAESLSEQSFYRTILRSPIVASVGAVLILSLMASFQAARFISTVWELLRNPNAAFRSVAINWRRIALATDSHCPPELLPGIDSNACPKILLECRFRSVVKLIGFVKNFDGQSQMLTGWVVFLCSLWIFPILYLPSLLYRFSLKSTSLLYLPFLFIIRSHLGEDLLAKDRINDFRFGATEQVQWWYAWIVLFVHSVSLLTLSANFAALNFEIPPDNLIAAFLVDQFLPTDGQQLRLKGWHVARFANAAIFIWLFFFADRADRRLNSGYWTDDQVTAMFDKVRRVQVALALYTTLCALIRIIQFAFYAKLPSVGFEFLP